MRKIKLQIQDDVCGVSFVYGNELLPCMNHESNGKNRRKD